jgi:hypothetical protein
LLEIALDSGNGKLKGGGNLGLAMPLVNGSHDALA